MKKLAIPLTIISACCLCIDSHAQSTIHWFNDSVLDSAQRVQDTNVHISTLADTSQLLMKSLPQYQFSTEYIQSQSIARLLKKLPNSCAPNRIKTPERLKDNIYSLPLNIYLSLKLYYKKNMKSSILPKNALDENKRLKSLAALFTGKSTYTLGVNDGRSFGIFLDAQIAALEKHNLVVRSGTESTTSLVKMLIKDRIDYTIEYPVNVHRVLKETAANISLESLEIVGSPSYIVGYVACSKSAVGKHVIKDINAALQKLYHSADFYQAHTRYLDKNDIANFNRAYQETFQVGVPTSKK
ncbi:hypothetical protein [Colwellia psychrerythraea]|uniref:Solute-binding protein family 3/N-terminal domain-containing protein n=1 Tax=Colwellia psychrerythraea TaxID=28229 RepID=A0A099KGQ5_COLPS|nr:hypothetical protein [Colwellia psychrerythraea]KGJ89157.1 hypothetical protein GAB14E_4153 [Colwellia psychrerythraea]